MRSHIQGLFVLLGVGIALLVLARFAAPVLSVNEAVAHPQTEARRLVFERTDYRGLRWPMMGSPVRLEATAPRTEQPMGGAMAGGHQKSSPLALPMQSRQTFDRR